MSRCTHCGAEEEGGSFCTRCGSSLAAAAPTAAVAPARRGVRPVWIISAVLLLVVASAFTTVAVIRSTSSDTAAPTVTPTVVGTPGDDEAGVDATDPSSSGQPDSTPAAPVATVPLPLNPTVIVLDASGSMKEQDAPGPRIDAAKAAVRTLVEGLPDGAPVGLIVYGTSTDGSDAAKAAGCQDVKTLVPVGPVDKAAFDGAVNGVVASGYTPIGGALRAAAAQLPASGDRNIVVVSDGEDTCAPPEPCDVAKEVAGDGLAIHTVGFRVSGTAKDQLTCIAQAGGGRYVDVANATQLQALLRTAVDPNAVVDTLTHQGFGDLKIGMTVDQAKSVDPSIDAAAAGTVVVVWRDCDLTFTDGTLVAVGPRRGSSTQDGLAIGDDAAKAAQLYGSSAVQTDNDRSHAIFAVEPGSDVGYDITFTPATVGLLAGPITRIVLCRCAARFSTALTAVNPDDYFKTPGRWWFRTPDDGWNCSITANSRVFCDAYFKPSTTTPYSTTASYPPVTSEDIAAADCGEIGLVAGSATLDPERAQYGQCGRGEITEFVYDLDKGVAGPGRILADGQELRAGGFRCFVTGFAVTCTVDPGNGVGFTVDQGSRRVYPRDGSVTEPGVSSCPTSEQLIRSFAGTDPSLVPADVDNFTDIRCAAGPGPLQRWLAAVGHFADGSTRPVLLGWDPEEKYWFERTPDAATCSNLPSEVSQVCSVTSATAFEQFVGSWGRHTSALEIKPDRTGSVMYGSGCCNSIEVPVTYRMDSDGGTLIGTVAGPAAYTGSSFSDLKLPVGKEFRFHFEQSEPSRAGDPTGLVIVQDNVVGGSEPIVWCGDVYDGRCGA